MPFFKTYSFLSIANSVVMCLFRSILPFTLESSGFFLPMLREVKESSLSTCFERLEEDFATLKFLFKAV